MASPSPSAPDYRAIPLYDGQCLTVLCVGSKNWRTKFQHISGSHSRAVNCGLEKEIPCFEAELILWQQMLLVSRGVGWSRSLCYWRCPGAVLCCVSGVWIKCPFLVPPSRVKFNFGPITSSPCANTPAAANGKLLFSLAVCLSWSSELFHGLPLLAFSNIWKSEASSASQCVVSPLNLDQLTKQINTSAVYLLSRVMGSSLPRWQNRQLNRGTMDYSFITGAWNHSDDGSLLNSNTNPTIRNQQLQYVFSYLKQSSRKGFHLERG